MRIANIFSAALLGLGLLLGATEASAYSRCKYDDLTGPEGDGRDQWAANWNYIRPDEVDLFDPVSGWNVYIEFANGCYRTGPIGGQTGPYCTPSVPVSATAPFMPGLIPVAFCYPSCYTPSQRVRFDGSYSTLEAAAKNEARTVTALSEDSTLTNLSFSEQPVEEIGSWPTQETIHVLHGEGGQRLEVTSGHPMVRSDGSVVKAFDLREGDFLLSEAGRPVRLVRIEKVEYKGNVMNVRPVSQKKVENILVAGGFLTGSQRFQIQWADQLFRLFVRGRVDAGAVLAAK